MYNILCGCMHVCEDIHTYQQGHGIVNAQLERVPRQHLEERLQVHDMIDSIQAHCSWLQQVF